MGLYCSVNNEQNNALFAKYRSLMDEETKIFWGGRLGDYKYYDMDKTIKAALNLVSKI